VSNVQQVRDLYEAFGRGDVPTVLGAMEPDTQWSEAEGHPYQMSGKAWVGPDAIMQNLFMKLGTEWDAFTAHSKEFYDAGDTVVVEERYRGTTRQPARAPMLSSVTCSRSGTASSRASSSSWTRRRCKR
jgi:uncharacterized protein